MATRHGCYWQLPIHRPSQGAMEGGGGGGGGDGLVTPAGEADSSSWISFGASAPRTLSVFGSRVPLNLLVGATPHRTSSASPYYPVLPITA